MTIHFSKAESAAHFLLDRTVAKDPGKAPALSRPTRWCNKAGNLFLKPLRYLFEGSTVDITERSVAPFEEKSRFKGLKKIGAFCLALLGFLPGVAFKALSCVSRNMRRANTLSLKLLRDRSISTDLTTHFEKVRAYARDRLSEIAEEHDHNHLNAYIDALPEALREEFGKSDGASPIQRLYLQVHADQLEALESVLVGETNYDTREVFDAYEELATLIHHVLEGPNPRARIEELYQRFVDAGLEDFLIDAAVSDSEPMQTRSSKSPISPQQVIETFGSQNPHQIQRLLAKLPER